jgi:nicotinate-nucleotide pyrophosphorylase (carboxylating)
MNDLVAARLERDGLDVAPVEHLVRLALDEDLCLGPDITTEATISPQQVAQASVVARQPGVVCGLTLSQVVLEAAGFPLSGVFTMHDDGDVVSAGTPVLRLSGALAPMLLAERTMLNLLTHLSGIATATNEWVRELSGTNCKVRDTRKTTPGSRQLEKYAVRCGGGTNHRFGLGDAALIKDNHIAAAGGITAAVAAIRRRFPHHLIEVECDNLDQVREAVSTECQLILLDNMTIDSVRAALDIVRSSSPVLVEVSGGVTLDSARSIAMAGADFIAVGALTHSVVALDFGLDM